MRPNQLYVDVGRLQDILTCRATGLPADDAEYQRLRGELVANPLVKELLPKFVYRCRDLGQFWGFIKQEVSQYQPRRDFLTEAFRPALDAIEAGLGAPVHVLTTETLSQLDEPHVHQLWDKALTRSSHDPEGAITAARALVESVCKLVLDALGKAYDAEADLPKLYKTTASALQLGVDQHQQQVFKQILGGLGTVVDGFAAVRNKLGDAHGQGAKPVRPAVRHALLSVNIAGTMALFIVQTFEHLHGDKLRKPTASDDDDLTF